MLKERVIFRQFVRPTLMAGLVFMMTICYGCAQTGNLFGNLKKTVSPGGDEALLEKAFAAYEGGRLAESDEIFQELYDNSGSLTIRRQALYGLSACRMVMAETPEAFSEAYSLWSKWKQIRAKSSEYEDPVYLDPFLKCKFPQEEKIKEETSIQGACAEGVTQYEYEEAQNRISILEAKLRTLEEQYSIVKSENDTLAQNQDDKDETIKTLKEKIRALEDIDQKIQEKKNKTEISSPE